ncbi:reverse transcriptase domain-containing protein [Microcoleus sp. S28C3]|uniref:reverse transcriptase domain-containing protein n=1 Tax=Microcoleus sp. S28C3 TaxID=3055414 RepID=UPI002FCF29E1
MQNHRSFHPYIADAYTAVHQWLATKPEVNGYQNISSYKQCDDNKEPFKSAAAQYSLYFPTHYFKVIHTLENIITREKLLTWLDQNRNICLVDVGCGAGAASIAFVEITLRLKKQEKITHPVNIYCLGIDVNKWTLAIYNKLITQVQPKVVSSQINLEFHTLPKSIGEAVIPAIRCLSKKREQWQQPFLCHVLMIHSTVVDLLSSQHKREQQEYEELKELGGIDSDLMVGNYAKYSEEYALAYKLLFEEVPIDRLYVITIGTDADRLPVQEMSDALAQGFKSSHHNVDSNLLIQQIYRVYYENPIGSYWKDIRKNNKYYSNFHVDVSNITSAKLHQDNDWHEVISTENIERAWVCTRKYLFEESLFDEVEIRLFEINLEDNIYRLQKQLIAYVQEEAHKEDYIPYNFVKSSSSTRPKGLSRMEGEIISTAIIQKLGGKASRLQGNSYAYRLPAERERETEYLYENWFTAYSLFLSDLRMNAQNYENGVVIRVDIESYYTRIVQDSLLELTKDLTESERIRWLLKILLSKELDEHQVGYGITQGSIGSAFYANLYLKQLDLIFGTQPSDNEWKVMFSRYMDDMILFVPDADDVLAVLDTLNQELEKLNLNLNKEKTEIYDRVSDFVESIKEDDLFKEFSQEFDRVMNGLWIGNSQYRKEFAGAYRNNDYLWGHLIEQYQECLCSINIYIKAPDVSRRIYKYLFNTKKRRKDLKREVELNLPPLPSEGRQMSSGEWAYDFQQLNYEWIGEKDRLKTKLISLFRESLKEIEEIPKAPNDPKNIRRQRTLKTYIRFAVNKLLILGFTEIVRDVVEILCEKPWVLREPLQILESLAIQGYLGQLIEVIAYYQNSSHKMSEYIRAVSLRAIRFSPTINEDAWEKVVEYSINGTLVERLMATETWLCLAYNNLCDHLVQDSHIENVSIALHSEPLPKARLKKNYLLILGLYKRDAISDESVDNNDYMLCEAYKMALQGTIEDLFENYEPKIIRDKYYSGKDQSNGDGEAKVSPFS